MDILQTIKRLVLRGNVLFTRKAEDEMARDGIAIYTKDKVLKVGDREVFHVLVSSKKSTT